LQEFIWQMQIAEQHQPSDQAIEANDLGCEYAIRLVLYTLTITI